MTPVKLILWVFCFDRLIFVSIDTVQIQFGVCQRWKSYTIEVL